MLIDLSILLLALALLLRFTRRFVRVFLAQKAERETKLLAQQIDWNRPSRARMRRRSPGWQFWR